MCWLFQGHVLFSPCVCSRFGINQSLKVLPQRGKLLTAEKSCTVSHSVTYTLCQCLSLSCTCSYNVLWVVYICKVSASAYGITKVWSPRLEVLLSVLEGDVTYSYFLLLLSNEPSVPSSFALWPWRSTVVCRFRERRTWREWRWAESWWQCWRREPWTPRGRATLLYRYGWVCMWGRGVMADRHSKSLRV